ncbi:MAG: hypothetical protein ACR2IV_12215 [Bryobacteraceae bacterium]
MPRYRIHRLKELPCENFRWAPHTGGLAIVKSKDYEVDGEVEATSPYGVWKALLAESRPLRPGDLLEISHVDETAGQLYIVKYIGFEPASWHVGETRDNSGTGCGDTSNLAGTPLRTDPV